MHILQLNNQIYWISVVVHLTLSTDCKVYQTLFFTTTPLIIIIFKNYWVYISPLTVSLLNEMGNMLIQNNNVCILILISMISPGKGARKDVMSHVKKTRTCQGFDSRRWDLHTPWEICLLLLFHWTARHGRVCQKIQPVYLGWMCVLIYHLMLHMKAV